MSSIVKINDFTQLKKFNIKYLKMLQEHSGFKSEAAMDRISECGDYLDLMTDVTGTHIKVAHGSYCHDRWCPICTSRRMYRNMIKLQTITEFLRTDPDDHFLPVSDLPLFKTLYDKYGYNQYWFVWVTLTVRNVKGADLYDTVRRINKAWKRLYQSKNFMHGFNDGFCCIPECTYNPDTDTYHPHLHVLIAVRRSYFNKYNIMRQSELLELWKRSYRDDSINSFGADIRRVDPQTAVLNIMQQKKDSLTSVAEYMNKIDISYLYSWDTYKWISLAYHCIQEFHFSGVFRMAAMLYDADLLTDYMPVEDIDYCYSCQVRFNSIWMQYEIIPDTFRHARTLEPVKPPEAVCLVLLI